MFFIPVLAKLNFQQPLLLSSASHDPSEIILICSFLIIIKTVLSLLKTVVQLNSFVETDFFSEFFDE